MALEKEGALLNSCFKLGRKSGEVRGPVISKHCGRLVASHDQGLVGEACRGRGARRSKTANLADEIHGGSEMSWNGQPD